MNSNDGKGQVAEELHQGIVCQIVIRIQQEKTSPLLPESEPQLDKTHIKPSPSRPSELVGERYLVLLIIMVLVIASVALIVKALVTATSGDEILKVLEIMKSLLPALITLLTPILHHYFRQKQGDEDDNCNSKD